VLCISLHLPLEVEGVENLLISERGSSNISRNPAQGDKDATNYVTAGAATARKGIDKKTKQGDDVVSPHNDDVVINNFCCGPLGSHLTRKGR
jgi:hypothetical protein